MRDPWPEELEQGRLTAGEYASIRGDRFGAFYVASDEPGNKLRIIANDANRDSNWWEHVSVSLEHRAPTWSEMCRVKDLFWADHEVVLQFHPAKQDYVNCHPYCLHLWRHKWKMKQVPLPPALLVGPK
jgi:hypothetical protein